MFWFLTKAVCVIFLCSCDTCFISCISIPLFLLYGIMDFLTQPCKIAVKIQQLRHKMYLSSPTELVTMKEMKMLSLLTTNFILDEFCIAFCRIINVVSLLVPFKLLFQVIDLQNKNLSWEWNKKLRNTNRGTHDTSTITLSLRFLPFSCWYVFKMSGMGENTSDPSRAETRKRKDPDQLGPRLDQLCLKTMKENELEKVDKWAPIFHNPLRMTELLF